LGGDMKIKIISISDLIVLMIFTIDMGAYFFESNFFSRYLPFLLGLNLIAFFIVRSKDYVYLLMVFTIIFLCCMIKNQDSSLNIMSILINISIGFYLYQNYPNKTAILFLMIFFLMMLIFRFYINFDDIEKVLISGSVNYISVIALSATALYYTFVPEKNRPVHIFPALLACVLCVLSSGRSAIACSVILLIGLFLYNYSFARTKVLMSFAYTGILFVTLFTVLKYADLLYSVDQPSSLFWRFSFDYSQDGRASIIAEYFSNFSFLDFLFGKGNSAINETLGLSIHISYIQWHISLGALAILLYVLVLFAYFKMFLINKLYWLIMTVILLRAATDHVMLSAGFVFGPLLIFFCSIIYYPYYHQFKNYTQHTG
jgi:hypothetical protein